MRTTNDPHAAETARDLAAQAADDGYHHDPDAVGQTYREFLADERERRRFDDKEGKA